MKMRNGMYLFAAAIVAGTVGLSSCSNDEEAVVGNGSELTGATNDVTLSLSVKGASKRITGDEANQGNTIQAIKNIWVVPMVGSTYQTPISMGTYTPSATLLQKVVKLNENITQFKVYGNVADNFANESAIFDGATFVLQTATDLPEGMTSKYEPHALYYYGLAGVTENPLIGYTSTDFTGEGQSITAGNAIGTTYKSIKISGVNYSVGLLAVGVQNGDTEAQFYPIREDDNLTGEAVAAGPDVIEVAGMIINGQYRTLDADFNKVGSEDVAVYEEAAEKDFVTTSLAFVNSKVAGANVYSVVSYTGAQESVAMNVVFTLKQGHFIQNNDGDILGSADKDVAVYLPVTLSYDKATATNSSYTVFMKDYTTILNAKVTDWGRLSGEEVISTDVNLGVEIDADWNQGVIYSEEI